MSIATHTEHNLLTQCPICLEDYDVPRALPCLHTFCEKCLVDWIKLKCHPSGIRVSGFGTFVCPICKDEVTLPPQGITGFTHNFYVASLTGSDINRSPSPRRGTLRHNTRLEENITCQRCEEPGVSKLCLKCAVWLCPLCCDDHSRVKSTRGHVLSSFAELSDAAVPDTLSTSDLSICSNPEHGSSVYKFFCVSCKELACEHCQVEKHSAETHEVLSVITNIEHIRKKLFESLANLQERSLIYQSQHSDLNRYRKDMTRRYHATQKTIFKTVDMLQKRMLDFKTHIYRELKKSLSSQTNLIENYIAELANKIAVLDSLQDGVRSVLETGSNKCVLTQADTLIERGSMCLDEKPKFGKIMVKFPKVELVEKLRIDKLLYELIGTVSILSKEVDVGPGVEKVVITEKRRFSYDESKTASPPVDGGISVPLILTQSCPTVDQLPSPTETSVSDLPSEKLSASKPDIYPLSEGEDAGTSRLSFPSPKPHEHERLQESESQSTTCDDDSDSATEEKVAKVTPPDGPFYALGNRNENPEQDDFWLPQGEMAERKENKMPQSPWKQLKSQSPESCEPVPTSSATERPPPSPPVRLMARRIKPFIKKWKARQNQNSGS